LKYRKYLFSLTLFAFSVGIVNAQKVCVGLFFDVPVKTVTLSSVRSEYTVWFQDSILIAVIEKGESMQITCNNNRLHIEGVGDYKEITALAGSVTGTCSLHPLQPALAPRTYSQNVVFRAVRGNIITINKTDEDFYLAGVCESEAGCGAQLSYYKVQSIMSRTYLYAHFDRHAADGFNMCDGVHCQAYKGVQTRCSVVKKAVAETEGVIVIDKSKKPIAPTYSANCGGQTCNSEDVWKNKLPYLRSTKDAYCRHTRSANWTKKIPLSQWRAFMNASGLYASRDRDFNFVQNARKKYYAIGRGNIELTKIRQQFGLRSAFFSVTVAGNDVVLTGRGFGHGVGVCQEGAMRMAESGVSYKKILQHYYRRTNVLAFAESKPHAYMLYEHGNIFNPWLGRMPLAIADTTLDDPE
jgi:stage II sporulation protein D